MVRRIDDAKREQILRLYLHGMSQREIALETQTSTPTVSGYIKAFRALGAFSHPDAVAKHRELVFAKDDMVRQLWLYVAQAEGVSEKIRGIEVINKVQGEQARLLGFYTAAEVTVNLNQDNRAILVRHDDSRAETPASLGWLAEVEHPDRYLQAMAELLSGATASESLQIVYRGDIESKSPGPPGGVVQVKSDEPPSSAPSST